MPEWKDLGLTYEQALHGIQSAILQRISHDTNMSGEWSKLPDRNTSFAGPKHLRVGVDTSKAEQGALAALLVRKGVITKEEYFEEMRLALNQELANYESMLSEILGYVVSFR